MHEIVQAYVSEPPSISSNVEYLKYQQLDPAAKERVHELMAEENGIEKPKGDTVSFHYNPEVEQHHFGSKHPMKPWRLQLTKQLVFGYGLQYAMDLNESLPASQIELQRFHDKEYLDFLKYDTETKKRHQEELNRYEFTDEYNDCPIFDGIWDYVTLCAGATLEAAHTLSSGQSNIAISWSGGLHHAKKRQASGFCYVNDIVLAIQHLLEKYVRVLYIDIDVHHGDGVEAAFFNTDRVMTLSYHKYGEFFPGTGGPDDTGPKGYSEPGAYFSLNVPLDDGIDDEDYEMLFSRITGKTIAVYQPEAIVLQCGADSLGGDRLGKFNLNIRAHGKCVEFVKAYRLPLLVLGGGGYTPRNVARTWCHETALCVGAQLQNDLPTFLPYRAAFEGVKNGEGILYPDLNAKKNYSHPKGYEKKDLEVVAARCEDQLRCIETHPVVKMSRYPKLGEILNARKEIDQEIKEDLEDRGHEDNAKRRRLERNIGGRHEHREYGL
ncbi:histone deacetylase 3 [Saccharata proteae CBS 121410]|uniref:Histone deacetylase n=1 Tax=Saccharata proteae CBS 121410 TaxID=1314787 RepID=A0A9P4LY78_9PEZI|nr:histone deacetylase 3 [Saccharata proteae CBS 121410]